eukprot:g77802.t1
MSTAIFHSTIVKRFICNYVVDVPLIVISVLRGVAPLIVISVVRVADIMRLMGMIPRPSYWSIESNVLPSDNGGKPNHLDGVRMPSPMGLQLNPRCCRCRLEIGPSADAQYKIPTAMKAVQTVKQIYKTSEQVASFGGCIHEQYQ